MSNSLQHNGPQPTGAHRLLCPWDFLGKDTRIGCHALLQGLFQTQGSIPGLPHCREILYCLSHQGSPFEDRVLFNSCFPGSERSAGKGIGYLLQYSWDSLVAQLVKKPPAMQDFCISLIFFTSTIFFLCLQNISSTNKKTLPNLDVVKHVVFLNFIPIYFRI